LEIKLKFKNQIQIEGCLLWVGLGSLINALFPFYCYLLLGNLLFKDNNTIDMDTCSC